MEEKSTEQISVKTEKDKKEKSDILTAKSLGLAYMEENELEKAEEQFKLLVKLSPLDATGYANLGVVYLRQGKNDAAEKNLLKAVELAPDDPDIRLKLAKVYELKDDQEASLEELKKNEEMAPDHIKTLYSIAEKYEGSLDAQSVSQWENYMRKIVENSPLNIVSRLYLIEALLRNGEEMRRLKTWKKRNKSTPIFHLRRKSIL